MKKKLNTKDLIYIGAFCALYIIVLFAIVMILGFVPILYLLSPFFVGIIAATVYMMYVSKIKKFGPIIILGAFWGLVMTMGGHATTILFALPIAIGAEFICRIGKYESKKMLSLSFLLFNVTMVAPFTSLYFASETFIAEANEYYGAEYADVIQTVWDTVGWGLMGIQMVVAVLGAAVGVVLANVLFKKHFEKAGII